MRQWRFECPSPRILVESRDAKSPDDEDEDEDEDDDFDAENSTDFPSNPAKYESSPGRNKEHQIR